MNEIRHSGIRILVSGLALLAWPCDALAGFEWIGWWHETSVGKTIFFSGSDLPNGVHHMGARIEVDGGYLGSDPPLDLRFTSSIDLSRPFSLSGSPGGWRVDLDWLTLESTRFTLHMNSSMPSSMHVSDNLDPSNIVDSSWSAANRSIILPDGEYEFHVSTAGVLSFPIPPPGFTFDFHTGHLMNDFRASLIATAVPEPASWHILAQGIAAAGTIAALSRRGKRRR